MRSVLKKFRDYFLVAWYVALAVMGGIVVYTAFSAETTPNDPTGEAGLFAALLALIAAVIALTRATTNIELPPPYDAVYSRFVATSMSLGLIVGAYFWVSSETNTHPNDPQLQVQITAIIVLVFGLAAALVPFILFIVAVFQLLCHWWNRFTGEGAD